MRRFATPLMFLRLLLAFYLACFNSQSFAGEVRVAVASNFTPTLKEISALFENETGHRIKISSGSSGKLYSQIRSGAPFDVFFSADQEKPSLLVKENLAFTDSQRTYVLGRLALWSNKKYDSSLKNILESGHYRKVALANPKVAPYGIASIEVLNKLNAVNKSKWVLGENISQTFQFIQTGAADLGFVSLSHLKIYLQNIESTIESTKANGVYWLVPNEYHAPIIQDAVIIKSTKQLKLSNEFLSYFSSPEIRALLKKHGFTLPE